MFRRDLVPSYSVQSVKEESWMYYTIKMEATGSKVLPHVEYSLPIDKALRPRCLAPLSTSLWENKISKFHINIIKPNTPRPIHSLNNFLFTITSSLWNIAKKFTVHFLSKRSLYLTLHLNKLRQKNTFLWRNYSRCPPSLYDRLCTARTSVTRRLAHIQKETPHTRTEIARKITLCVRVCVCVRVRVGKNHSNYIHSQKTKVANTVEAKALTLRVRITDSWRYRQSCLEWSSGVEILTLLRQDRVFIYIYTTHK
jgi:hypothetical protein